mmetsp:Transcript_24604/g.45929  ORF Transcript_24604/g.45929 Transcript_24604/m.45929 type:complete len:385 (-) Transcript_24604:1950-3104(-)
MIRPSSVPFLVLVAGCVFLLLSLHVDVVQPLHFADEFPSLDETNEMARLSLLVYKFRYKRNFTCDNFHDHTKDKDWYADVQCHWYFHDVDLGTQVLLASNDDPHKKYVAVVFAGTDDLRTSLEDADILTKRFGNNETVQLPDNYIKVHAGFNNAVFSHNIWEQVYNQTSRVLRHKQDKNYKLYTTGHSLGAANAILTATAFASQTGEDALPNAVKSINFGCPQIGNDYWRGYFNATSPLREKIGIWRVVLAWDPVARLPELFYHVGHTIQVDGKTNDVRVYYEHYGDESKGYAQVPTGWYSRSYAWLPFALGDHRMHKYLEHLGELNQTIWPNQFYPVDGTVYDDDIWDNPPTDDWILEERITEEDDGEEGDFLWYEKVKSLFF